VIKWMLIAAAIVAVLGVTLTAAGYLLPRTHTASRTRSYAAPPPALFEAISDVRRYAEWRTGVTQVDILPDDGKGLRFREHGRNGSVLFRFESLDPPRRVVARIADPKLPFGGAWTYDLQASGTGTSLTITEDGEVSNPIVRVMQRLFFSPLDTIDQYLADLNSIDRGKGQS
jgi:uncharacterized protein YndB with AHSA1/START domain